MEPGAAAAAAAGARAPAEAAGGAGGRLRRGPRGRGAGARGGQVHEDVAHTLRAPAAREVRPVYHLSIYSYLFTVIHLMLLIYC